MRTKYEELNTVQVQENRVTQAHEATLNSYEHISLLAESILNG